MTVKWQDLLYDLSCREFAFDTATPVQTVESKCRVFNVIIGTSRQILCVHEENKTIKER